MAQSAAPGAWSFGRPLTARDLTRHPRHQLAENLVGTANYISKLPQSYWEGIVARASDASDKASLAAALRATAARAAAKEASKAAGESLLATGAGASGLVATGARAIAQQAPRAALGLSKAFVSPEKHRTLAAPAAAAATGRKLMFGGGDDDEEEDDRTVTTLPMSDASSDARSVMRRLPQEDEGQDEDGIVATLPMSDGSSLADTEVATQPMSDGSSLADTERAMLPFYINNVSDSVLADNPSSPVRHAGSRRPRPAILQTPGGDADTFPHLPPTPQRLRVRGGFRFVRLG